MTTHGTSFTYRTGGARDDRSLVIVPLATRPKPPMPLIEPADRLSDGVCGQLIAAGAVRDEVGRLAHGVSSKRVRVLLVALGDAAKASAADIRGASAAAARWLICERVTSARLMIDGLTALSVDDSVAEWALASALAGFRYARFKPNDDNAPPKVTVSLVSGAGAAPSSVMKSVRDSLVLADAVNLARRLGHEPPNVLHPEALAEEARTTFKGTGVRVVVLGEAELRKRGMNGLLAVGAGAAHPSCLIQLSYRGAAASARPTVLVGKSVTFDTGGYSIKPADNMDAMKFDMCGGAAVMGVLWAAAALELRCNVVGVLAAAENAISEHAYRPGDILRMMSGKTVEITNTDAEGRLVLADALCYAQRAFKPREIIDLATLTGGVRIALGTAAAGLMGNDDALAADLGEAGRRTHERLWRLPLWDDYRELIRTQDADIKNSSGKREAHAIVGGMFLKEFVAADMPWAHLDIASVATSDAPAPLTGKGATGFGVRLLIEFLRRRG